LYVDVRKPVLKNVLKLKDFDVVKVFLQWEACISFRSKVKVKLHLNSDVNKDWTLKVKDKNEDQSFNDKDKDKHLTYNKLQGLKD